MVQGDSDFIFILAIAIIFVMWGGFILVYTTDQISEDESINLPQYKEDSGILQTLSISSSFLNPFSSSFHSDFFIINAFIFSILIFGIVIVAARYVRG